MNKLTRERILLWLGICIPFIYFINLIVLAALYPGYSHMSNWVSDLGRIEAPHHKIFNLVIFLSGILYLLTGLGFFYSVNRITGRKVQAIFIGVFIAVFGINYFFGAFYPLPDPRHGGYGIGLLHFFSPLLLAWAFWRLPDSRVFTIFQLLYFILILIFTVIPLEVWGVFNETNLGIFQRIQSVIIFAWFVYSCYWLIRFKKVQ